MKRPKTANKIAENSQILNWKRSKKSQISTWQSQIY